MKTKTMPTLSNIGWTSNAGEKLDFCLCHMFEASSSQSYLYSDKIVDVDQIFYKHGTDTKSINLIINELTTVVEEYLKQHFDNAVVEAMDITRGDKKETNRFDIRLTVKVFDNQQISTVSKLFGYHQSRLEKILNI